MLAVSLLAVACAVPFARYAPGTELVRTELYFGTTHDGQCIVSDEAWRSFLAEQVTPRFPDGLTVLSAEGQWRSDGGLVREPSRVIVLFHAPTREADDAIEAIRAAYKTRFHQESVMRVTEGAKVAF